MRRVTGFDRQIRDIFVMGIEDRERFIERSSCVFCLRRMKDVL